MLTWTFSLMDMSRIPALHPAEHDARRGISQVHAVAGLKRLYDLRARAVKIKCARHAPPR
jgi:hypothetical protein